MKRCSCEHWQICPTCYPQGFDEHGVRKPVEVPPSREELQRQAVALREQVEKLTKERDEWKNDAINGGNAGYLQKQLAALAEKNEKMREDLSRWIHSITTGSWLMKLLALSRSSRSDSPE